MREFFYGWKRRLGVVMLAAGLFCIGVAVNEFYHPASTRFSTPAIFCVAPLILFSAVLLLHSPATGNVSLTVFYIVCLVILACVMALLGLALNRASRPASSGGGLVLLIVIFAVTRACYLTKLLWRKTMKPLESGSTGKVTQESAG